MKTKSTKLAKSVSILQFVTGGIGLLTASLGFLESGFSVGMSVFTVLLSLISLPYLVAAYGLWIGSLWGLVLSFILNGLALFDFDFASSSWYLTYGFFFNIEIAGVGVDLWTLLILVGLVAVARQKRRSNQSPEATTADAAAPQR